MKYVILFSLLLAPSLVSPMHPAAGRLLMAGTMGTTTSLTSVMLSHYYACSKERIDLSLTEFICGIGLYTVEMMLNPSTRSTIRPMVHLWRAPVSGLAAAGCYALTTKLIAPKSDRTKQSQN